MNLTIDLNGVDPVIAEVKKIAAPESLAKANERMGEGVKSWLSSWYRNKAESGHFETRPCRPTGLEGRKPGGLTTLPETGLPRRRRTVPASTSPGRQGRGTGGNL